MPGFVANKENCNEVVGKPERRNNAWRWDSGKMMNALPGRVSQCKKLWPDDKKTKDYVDPKELSKRFSTNTKNVHSLATHGKIDATNRHSNIEHAAYDTGSLYRGYGGKKKTRKLKKGKKGTKKNRKGKKSKGRKSKK